MLWSPVDGSLHGNSTVGGAPDVGATVRRERVPNEPAGGPHGRRAVLPWDVAPACSDRFSRTTAPAEKQQARWDMVESGGKPDRPHGAAPQPYAVYGDERNQVWLSDFGVNTLVCFDPAGETFTVIPLPSRHAAVRQLLGRARAVWGRSRARTSWSWCVPANAGRRRRSVRGSGRRLRYSPGCRRQTSGQVGWVQRRRVEPGARPSHLSCAR